MLRIFPLCLVLVFAPAAVGTDASLVATPIPAARARLSTRVPEVQLTTIDGAEVALSDQLGDVATVVVMRDEACPLCRRFGPELARLEAAYAEHGVRFLFLDPALPAEKDAAARDRARFEFTGTFAVGPTAHRLARILGAATSTEVFVLDRSQTVRYHGAVSDRYGIGSQLPEARSTWLADALDALLAGACIAVPATTAPGCLLDLEPQELAPDAVTFHNRVSRILDTHCGACHRRGGPAPFTLDSYGRVKRRGAMIKMVIEEQLMPPWGAAPGTGPWANDRTLPERDRRDLFAWIDAGMPDGDPDDAPDPRPYPDDWTIGNGTPDAVVQVPKTFRIPAEGTLSYKYTWVQTEFESDRWIQSMEIRPSAPAHVHHVLVFLETPGWADPENVRGRGRGESGLRGYFAGLVPGQGATVFPPGFAKKLPKGAWLKFQIHYTANGEAAFDQTEMAFTFADGPPAHEMHTSAVATTRFRIPAHTAGHEVVATRTFHEPAVLVGFSPHMHLRGASFAYELIRPDGTTLPLLDVPRYDFDWQTMYRLAEPMRVDAGTMLRGRATYDNTAENPDNPDPDTSVGFGEQTWDEMMIGYYEWYRPVPDAATSPVTNDDAKDD